MKLLLQLAASILLTSVCAASWPYREIVGVGQSESPVFVAPVYGVAPVISPLDNDQEVATIVAGPVTGTTIVEGSSSGPVTVLSPVDAAGINDPSLKTNATEEPNLAKGAVAKLPEDATEDSVIIKGASSGPVTLVAPSAAVADNAPSAGTKTGGAVASSASVAIENAEESGRVSPTTIKETIGIASANAVIGPSTGPIIIVGPTAPPIPTTNVPTVTPIAADADTDVVGPAIAIDSLPATGELGNETASTAGAPEANQEISATSTATVPSSGNSTVSTSAKVNLITPAARIAATAETATSSIVVSAVTASTAHASDPAATVSGAAASALIIHPLP
ncbi:uncharacterized protein LOC143361082 [Halictus rubicundus]|uniref:uncharacterized protein LOC143361082 n=1 Tax=Halictus rubicundus TaxID=77578 RepID=UPI004035CB7F